ncbi:MAG: Gldg family protein, partial [Prevotellaceae bacterium]|nr:Gldg family protein [Prevotellaceae bacterium]
MKMQKNRLKYIITVVVLAMIVLLFAKIIFFRIDLTTEKRYTISKNSKELLKNLNETLTINIYLDDADINIARLKTAVNEMLDEFSVYAAKPMIYRYINPSEAATEDERNKNYYELKKRGFEPRTVSWHDNKGNSVSKIIFPWAEILSSKYTIPVCLVLMDVPLDEENVNASIEGIEYQFIDAIRILTQEKFNKIAFIKGHNELSELDTYFAREELMRYYQIDSITLGNDADVLKNYKAVVIAKPTEKFSESDKFILDQYIMNGGKVLWLLDAIRISSDELSKSGVSPVVPLELNLTDM